MGLPKGLKHVLKELGASSERGSEKVIRTITLTDHENAIVRPLAEQQRETRKAMMTVMQALEREAAVQHRALWLTLYSLRPGEIGPSGSYSVDRTEDGPVSISVTREIGSLAEENGQRKEANLPMITMLDPDTGSEKSGESKDTSDEVAEDAKYEKEPS